MKSKRIAVLVGVGLAGIALGFRTAPNPSSYIIDATKTAATVAAADVAAQATDAENAADDVADVATTTVVINPSTQTLIADVSTSTPVARHAGAMQIVLLGDMMLDRQVRASIDKYGPDYPFAQIEGFLAGIDVVVANAEGPFTDNPSQTLSDPKSGTITFDPAELPVLKRIGFTALSQANSDASDFGSKGLLASQKAIKAAGIDTFGDPSNTDPGPIYETVRGTTIALIGYDALDGSDMNVIPAIAMAKSSGAFVIVYAHWGQAYSGTVTSVQRSEAHKLIDMGANLVIGSHPHVIEPVEVYDGKAIFYSLGNFVFDQSNAGPTSQGLALSITLDAQRATYSLFPISIVSNQAIVMTNDDRDAVLTMLSQGAVFSTASSTLRSDIAAGSFTLPR